MTNGSMMSTSQSFQGVPHGVRGQQQQQYVMSSFKPEVSSNVLTPEEIERDVRIVLHNLGLRDDDV
jgi:hypothetical protein